MTSESKMSDSTAELPQKILRFEGTAVPVHALFEYLEAGDSIEEFLEAHPQVSRRQVSDLFERMRQEMAAAA